jgi:hypothetical protein
MAITGWLRAGTAVTVPIGPFQSSTDGNTDMNALTILSTDVLLSKNSGTFAAKSESSNSAFMTGSKGMYACALNTTDTNVTAIGNLTLVVHVATALIVRHDYLVFPQAIFDGLIAGTVALPLGWLPVNAFAPDFSVAGSVLTVETPAQTPSATAKTLQTDASAIPVVGASS